MVHLLEGIRTIGTRVFGGCRSWERIHEPSTLTAIGNIAFIECTLLGVVKLCGGIQRIGSDTFRRCSSLEHSAVPFKDLAITETGGDHDSRFVTDGTIPGTDL